MTEGYFCSTAFEVPSVVRSDYRSTPTWFPERWKIVPIKHPLERPGDHEKTLGQAVCLPHGFEGFPFEIKDPSAFLCVKEYPEQPELWEYEPGTERAVVYAVISEWLTDDESAPVGLVEYIPPGVTRPKRPAPYTGLPILAVLSW